MEKINSNTESFSDSDGGRVSVAFVLNVLRQHEIELDRLISELGRLVEKVNIKSEQIEK